MQCISSHWWVGHFLHCPDIIKLINLLLFLFDKWVQWQSLYLYPSGFVWEKNEVKPDIKKGLRNQGWVKFAFPCSLGTIFFLYLWGYECHCKTKNDTPTMRMFDYSVYLVHTPSRYPPAAYPTK